MGTKNDGDDKRRVAFFDKTGKRAFAEPDLSYQSVISIGKNEQDNLTVYELHKAGDEYIIKAITGHGIKAQLTVNKDGSIKGEFPEEQNELEVVLFKNLAKIFEDFDLALPEKFGLGI